MRRGDVGGDNNTSLPRPSSTGDGCAGRTRTGDGIGVHGQPFFFVGVYVEKSPPNSISSLLDVTSNGALAAAI